MKPIYPLSLTLGLLLSAPPAAPAAMAPAGPCSCLLQENEGGYSFEVDRALNTRGARDYTEYNAGGLLARGLGFVTRFDAKSACRRYIENLIIVRECAAGP